MVDVYITTLVVAAGYIVYQHAAIKQREADARTLARLVHDIADGNVWAERGADGTVNIKDK